MTVRFDLIGVVVSDMATSVAFYRTLGLSFPDGAESQPHVEAELPGGLRFALDAVSTITSFDPDFELPGPGDRGVALAFRCGDPTEVDTVHGALVAAGHPSERDPWDALWGQRYATVLDPDGNPVDLFAPLR
jgi:catechol 2,3-dioxygenase-like lactoylglutathione lyase family enzyme